MPVLCSLLITLLAAPVGAQTKEDPEAVKATVTGVVLDAAGAPVKGVAVTWMEPAAGTFDSFEVPFPNAEDVVTDARGRFALRVEPGKIAVVAGRRGAQVVTLRVVPVDVAAAGAKVVVRFDGTESIRGRAIDEQGQALAGVQVTVMPERTGAEARRGDAIVVRGWTAADGSFRFGGLRPGEHRLLAKTRGMRCIEPCNNYEGMKVRPGSLGVIVPLQPVGSVSGRVVRLDARGQVQPVPVFRVDSIAFASRFVAAEDGRFEIDVPRLWEGAPLFVRAAGLAGFGTSFSLTEPVALDLGDIVLGPGRSIRGRVLDGAGRPLEGATVRVGFVKDWLPEPSATTGPTGAFELAGVPAAPTPLVVAHPTARPRAVVVGGTPDVEVSLAAAVSLRVRVEDVDGSPVAGALVWSVRSPARGRTGADGTCVLEGLEQAEQIVEVMHPGARPQPQQLRVPMTTATPSGIVLRTPRQPSVLKVTVVNADGTFADASANVIPEHAAPGRRWDLSPQIDVPHYTGSPDLLKMFDNLPPGRYTVVADADGRCAAALVELGEGADLTVTVKLPAEPGPCRRQ